MWPGTMFACSSARKAPTWPNAFAPPPDNTSTTLFTPALIVAPLHHPIRAALGGPVVAAFLVGSLGNDLLHFRRPAILIECHVRDIAGIRVAGLARQHLLGEHLHADFHRRPAGEVHARHRRDEVADVDGLAEIDLVDRNRDAFAMRMANGGHRG